MGRRLGVTFESLDLIPTLSPEDLNEERLEGEPLYETSDDMLQQLKNRDLFVEVAGESKKLVESLQTLTEEFFDADRQFQILTDDFGRAFQQIGGFSPDHYDVTGVIEDRLIRQNGGIVPETREGFLQLIEAIDLTSVANAEYYAGLINLVPIADEYYDALEEREQSALNLRIQLLEAQGEAEDALALRREQSLEQATEIERGLMQQIYAAEDAASSLARQTAILTEQTGLEDRLLQAKGMNDQLQALQRERELAALQGREELDDHQQVLFASILKSIYEAEDAAASLAKQTGILSEQTSLEDRLLQAKGNDEELQIRERESEIEAIGLREDLDEATKNIFINLIEGIHLAEDEAAEFARRAAIENETASLEDRLLQAQGNDDELLRRKRLAELNELNSRSDLDEATKNIFINLIEGIYHAEDAAVQMAEKSRLANSLGSLQLRLLEAQGKDQEALALRRQQELKGMATQPEKDLLRQIHLAEDLRTYKDKQAEEARRHQEAQAEALRQRQEQEKARLEKAHQTRMDNIQDEIQAHQDALSRVQGIFSALDGAYQSLLNQSEQEIVLARSQAQQELQLALSQRRLPDQERLNRILPALTSESSYLFEDEVSYQRDLLTTRNTLEALAQRAQREVSSTERTISTLETAMEREKQNFDSQNTHLERYFDTQTTQQKLMSESELAKQEEQIEKILETHGYLEGVTALQIKAVEDAQIVQSTQQQGNIQLAELSEGLKQLNTKVESLQTSMEAGQFAIANNTLKTRNVLEYWSGDGIPLRQEES